MYKNLAICLLFFIIVPRVHAIGSFMTDGTFQVIPTEVKILAILEPKKETVFASLAFSFNPLTLWMLGFISYTPSKPVVSALQDDVFLLVDKYTQKTLTKDALWKKIIYANTIEERSLPAQIVSRKASIRQPLVYGEDFRANLEKHDYVVPKHANVLFQKLQDEGAYLVETRVENSHIQTDATDEFTVNTARTLPIKLEFASDTPIIPMRLLGVEQDTDSADSPMFSYGASSKEILGETNENIDALLSTQSTNTYHSVPIGSINVKIEITVIAPQKMRADGFTTIFADTLPKDLQQTSFWTTSKNNTITRLFRYLPIAQVDDITLKIDPDKRRVNTKHIL